MSANLRVLRSGSWDDVTRYVRVDTRNWHNLIGQSRLGGFRTVRKAFMLEVFAYESIGSCIANIATAGRVDFIP